MILPWEGMRLIFEISLFFILTLIFLEVISVINIEIKVLICGVDCAVGHCFG